MEKEFLLKKFFEKNISLKDFSFKKHKKALFLLIVFGIFIMLSQKALFSPKESVQGSEKVKKSDNYLSCDDEKRLCDILEKIMGAGRVEVMITYDSTAEKITVSNSKTSKSESGDEDKKTDGERNVVMQKTDGNEIPFVKNEIYPKVRGVLVVADGGENKAVCENLKKAVCAALDVPIHKVEIMPRRK